MVVVRKENQKQTRIVLIGPAGAGKTTIAERLAQRLKIPFVSVDEISFPLGRGKRWRQVFRRRPGDTFLTMSRRSSAFMYYPLKRVLETHRRGVIDVGVPHCVPLNNQILTQLKRALAQDIVILLLPSPTWLTLNES
jgi:adenylate kinase